MARGNTKILETLNIALPSLEDTFAESDETQDETNQEDLDQIVKFAETAASNLAMLDGDGHSQAMDLLHKETLQHARDVMDLAFNADQRSMSSIIEKSNMLYNTSLLAKSSKRDAQLKAMKLALDKRKLDLEERKLQHLMGEKVVEAVATVVVEEDRNEIIKRLREQLKEESNITGSSDH